MKIQFFDTLESTNNYCKLLDLNTVEEFTVICARSQTAGIGQRGNVWVSEAGKNLTFSLILKPSFLPSYGQYQLTMMLAVAVADTVATILPRHTVSIKWPNDIYIGNSKICGILTTNRLNGTTIDSSICGIGLNVNQTEFPEWLPNPVSLKQLTRIDHNVDDLLFLLLDNIKTLYCQLHTSAKEIEESYTRRLYRLGVTADYEYLGKPIRASILGVDSFGHLQLLTSRCNTLSCDMKEIKFLI